MDAPTRLFVYGYGSGDGLDVEIYAIRGPEKR